MGIDSSAPDHGDGDHRDPGPHGDLDEAAAAEAPQAVAVGVGLGRTLGAFGEDEGELPLVAQEAQGVVGVGGHAHRRGPTWCRTTGASRKK